VALVVRYPNLDSKWPRLVLRTDEGEAKESTMEQVHIRKELSDLMLCLETLLMFIRKGAPLNSVEEQLIAELGDMLRDELKRQHRGAVLAHEALRAEYPASIGPRVQ